jgi:AbrB family looped-hinge helix DNA binding protein
MRASIDEAGRLVIPRGLRDRVGLAAGGEVEIYVDGTAIRIEPASSVEIREKDGLLFIPSTRKALDDAAVRRLIDADRSGR